MIFYIMNASIVKVAGIPEEKQALWDLLSFSVPTRFPQYGGKFGYVKKSKLDRRNNSFGYGLLDFVIEKLKDKGINCEIKQQVKSKELEFREDVKFKEIVLEDYQERILKEVGKYKRGIIESSTGCLSGNTKIRVNRASRGFEISLAELYYKQNGINNNSYHGKNWDLTIPTKVRSFNGNLIQLNTIEKVIYSGIKKTYKLTLFNEKKLVCTNDHKIMTKRGFVRLRDLKKSDLIMCDTLYPQEGNKKNKKCCDSFIQYLNYHPFAVEINSTRDGKIKRIEIHRAIYESHINNISLEEYIKICSTQKHKVKELNFINPKYYHIHHIDFNHYNNDIENLVCLEKLEHQQLHGEYNYTNFNQGIPVYSRMKSIKYMGYKKTYDIQCKSPDNNFNANGIIVHNSGKSIVIAGIIKKFYMPRTLVVVPTTDIARNTIRELEKLLRIPIGLVGDGSKEFKKVTVILYQSLSLIKNLEPLNEVIELQITDECHLANEALEEILKKFTNVWYRYGLSATPVSSGKKKEWLTVTSQMGEKFITITDKQAEKRVAKVDAFMFPFIGKSTSDSYLESYRPDVLLSEPRCKLIAKMTNWAFKEKKIGNILILVDEYKQAKLIHKMLEKEQGIYSKIASSNLSSKELERIKEDFNSKKLQTCIATTTWGVGTNIRETECIILGSARKSNTNTKQRAGRGIRRTDIKDTLLLLDVYDKIGDKDRYFQKFSEQRLRLYERKKWFRGFITL